MSRSTDKYMVLGYEPWYPAEVCLPLLDLLRFCVMFEKNYLLPQDRDTATAEIDAIERLLLKHKKDGEHLNNKS